MGGALKLERFKGLAILHEIGGTRIYQMSLLFLICQRTRRPVRFVNFTKPVDLEILRPTPKSLLLKLLRILLLD